jgi:flagellar biosynthesis chaperone FliJ
MREEKILQKLKEKKMEAYKFEMNKEESQALDGIAISRFAASEKEFA